MKCKNLSSHNNLFAGLISFKTCKDDSNKKNIINKISSYKFKIYDLERNSEWL